MIIYDHVAVVLVWLNTVVKQICTIFFDTLLKIHLIFDTKPYV